MSEERVLVNGQLVSLGEAIHGRVIDWPEGLTPKARQLLERRFTVGRVRAESCEPGDEPFIGCVAADYEGQGDPVWVTTSAKDIINELAEMDRLVGVRQPLECHLHEGKAIFSMRLMVRPDTAGAVLAKMAEHGGSSPYMDENTRARIPGPARFDPAAPPLIAKRTVVSPPGAAIEATTLELTPEARDALQVPAGAFGPDQRREGKPDLKPLSWWRCCVAWWAFEVYVFTGWRWSFDLMNWTVGGGLEPMPDGGA